MWSLAYMAGFKDGITLPLTVFTKKDGTDHAALFVRKPQFTERGALWQNIINFGKLR